MTTERRNHFVMGNAFFRQPWVVAPASTKARNGLRQTNPTWHNKQLSPFMLTWVYRRPDYLATGKEWRTRPLWGIGLINTINDHTRFLHDGRASNLPEAVLWHGGEAAKQHVLLMSEVERKALIAFLNSL